MRPKHILVPLIMSLAIFSFNPNLASEEIETINKEQQTEEAELIEEEQNKADEVEKVETNEVEENLLENIDSVKDNEKSNKNSNSKENNSQHKSKELNKTTKAETVSTNSINLSEQDIIQLKKNLTLLGFGNFPTNPSSVYGPVTSGVVKEFQQYFGLKVTGEVDANTLDKINEILNPPYKIGHRGLHIVELKNKLSKLGFGNFPNDPSIFYGSVTANVVKDFQKAYRLQADGIANKDTLNKLDEIIQHSLKIGDENEQVRELKKNLTQLGFGNFPKNPSTTYGKVTANVVKDFQRYYDLNVTGIADVNTLQKIKEVLEPPYKDGDRGLHIKELKENLTTLGFGNFPKNPSIFYGTVTANVVKDFQKSYELKPTGIANKETLSKIEKLLNPPFTIGDKGTHIRDLKQNLSKLGFGNFPSNPSIIFGTVTANVVKDFQKFLDLEPTGIVDETTYDLIMNGFKNNKKGVHVVALKKHLTKLGFGSFPSSPSTTYGNVTTKVVKEFQAYYGISRTGNVGLNTLKALNENVNSPYQNGKRGSHIVKLKKDLRNIGFGNFPKNPSNKFGSVTEKVVKDFQRAFGLKVNGIMDSVSLKVLKQQQNKVRIVIDAGHGGHDPGATGNGLREKDLTLYIAKEIEKQLKKYKNVEIKMVRSRDEYLALQERSKLANGWKADFYFSVHINAGGGTGIESYVHNNASRDAINKQSIIHDHLLNGLRGDKVRDRGKKKAKFHVLRETKMSAMLVEYLFIDNVTDANKLKNNAFKKKLARLTAEGIAKAFNLRR